MDNLQFKILELLKTKGDLLPSQIWRDPEIAIDMAIGNKDVMKVLGALVYTNQIILVDHKYHITKNGTASYRKELKNRSKKKEPHWFWKALLIAIIGGMITFTLYLIEHFLLERNQLLQKSQQTKDTSDQQLRDSIYLK